GWILGVTGEQEGGEDGDPAHGGHSTSRARSARPDGRGDPMRLNLWGEVRWFARAFARKFSADSTMDSAASLAFFAILAFFPFLIGMVSLASLLMNPRTVEVLLADLAEIAPPDVTRLVGEQLRGLVRAGSSGILTLSSFGAYWAASGGMSALMRALNRVNEVRETRPLWKSKGISLLTTLVAVFFLLTAA